MPAVDNYYPLMASTLETSPDLISVLVGVQSFRHAPPPLADRRAVFLDRSRSLADIPFMSFDPLLVWLPFVDF